MLYKKSTAIYILHRYATHTYRQTTSELYNISTLILIETKKYIEINADRYTYTILIDAILTLKLILIWHLINLYKRQAETRFRTE